MDFWLLANVLINAFVIAGGATILLSPLSRKFLRNGKTPLLYLIRVLVLLLMAQAGLRIWIESVEDGPLREGIRVGIGLTSLGAVLTIGNFLWAVIDGALTLKGEKE